MTREEVAAVVRQVLDEEHRLYKVAEDNLVMKTVAGILTAFGINEDDKAEIRADLIYLRQWRRTAEHVRRGWWLAATALLVSGIASALYLGLRALFVKG